MDKKPQRKPQGNDPRKPYGQSAGKGQRKPSGKPAFYLIICAKYSLDVLFNYGLAVLHNQDTPAAGC